MEISLLTLAFHQPATGPSSVCEGSDVTLQCTVVFTHSNNVSDFEAATWQRNGTVATQSPNHNSVYNGEVTNLEITNVRLEDDNTVYTCISSDRNITSSVVLNVTGNMHTYTVHVNMCVDH